MTWLREAISDSDGLADMAYLSIGALTVAAIATLSYIIAMETVSYFRCTRIVDVGQNVRAAVACQFNSLPIGQAAGLIMAAYAALIGALAGYMAATRRAINPGKVAPPAATVTATATIPASPEDGDGNVKPGRGRPCKPHPHGELG